VIREMISLGRVLRVAIVVVLVGIVDVAVYTCMCIVKGNHSLTTILGTSRRGVIVNIAGCGNVAFSS
jgi:hypothetical protein